MLKKRNIYQRKVDLSNQNLEVIPEFIFNFKNLRKLNLSNNKLKSIPKNISDLNKLESLDLSNNKIELLYANIFNLNKLRVLILNNNNLISFPKQIEKLVNLKILSLSGNLLQDLPPEFMNLNKLEELNISKNKFDYLPKSILSITSLKSLWVNNNSFKKFPIKEIREKLPKLSKLYCYGTIQNKYGDIDHSYRKLSKIKGNSLMNFSKGTNINEIKKGADRNQNVIHENGTGLEKKKSLKTKIFISYSHEDINWLKKVKKHLKVLNFDNTNIDVWEDTQIKSGDKWKVEIANSLAECKIAILLISTDFLASDFIQENELPPLLKAAEEKGTKILPLIIGHSRFLKNKNISIFQAVNDPASPLEDLKKNEQDKILVKLTDDIEDLLS